MAALLALVAAILTSFLPILNKRLLRDRYWQGRTLVS